MKTLIISSSLNPNSNSFKVCKHLKEKLSQKSDIEVELVDLRDFEIKHTYKGKTKDMEKLETMIESADNFIIGMAVHCYSINDYLKSLIDNCFPGKEHKLFGIIAAAGGERSYLSTQHLVQILMNEHRMLPLPRTLYVTKNDFKDEEIINENIHGRVEQFIDEFYSLAKKLV